MVDSKSWRLIRRPSCATKSILMEIIPPNYETSFSMTIHQILMLLLSGSACLLGSIKFLMIPGSTLLALVKLSQSTIAQQLRIKLAQTTQIV